VLERIDAPRLVEETIGTWRLGNGLTKGVHEGLAATVFKWYEQDECENRKGKEEISVGT